MGETLDRILVNTVNVTAKAFTHVQDFYDNKAKTGLGEAAKHLVPTYTLSRMSDYGAKEDWVVPSLAGVALTFGHIYAYVWLFDKIVK